MLSPQRVATEICLTGRCVFSIHCLNFASVVFGLHFLNFASIVFLVLFSFICTSVVPVSILAILQCLLLYSSAYF